MSGSEQPLTPPDARLSVAWLRQELTAHGPKAAPPEPDVDASLEGLADPPVDGVAASYAMLDAFRAGEALDELRAAREALPEAYAGLTRAFDDEADKATVFDDGWRDASRISAG